MNLPNYATVTPAYGRDYKSGKAAVEDWQAGKDFQLQPQGVYTSIRDQAVGTTVNIRYKKLTQVIPFKSK